MEGKMMLEGILSFIGLIVTIYGIYRGFVAHVLLGIILILLPPVSFVIGLVAFFGYDVPEKFMEWWRSRSVKGE